MSSRNICKKINTVEVQQKLQQQVVRYSNPGQGLPSATGHWSSGCHLKLVWALVLPDLWVCDAESLLSDPAALHTELGSSTLLLEQLLTSVCVTYSDTASVQVLIFFMFIWDQLSKQISTV